MRPQGSMGGYFGLELPRAGGEHYVSARRFQSARAAFLALLRTGQPERVHMPWYICDSMVEPLEMASVSISRYCLDDDLRISGDIDLGPGDWLFYVNYFGLSSARVAEILDRYPPEQVVIDCAQAFYAAPLACLATLYSPRKFFGVPDGGYLFTDLLVPEPELADDDSIERSRHLLVRADRDAEAGYGAFQAAERSLSRQEPRRMSKLTQRLLGSIDYSGAARRRQDNFAILHKALGGSNAFAAGHVGDDVPLCYPYLGGRPDARQALVDKRVFVATYWPELIVPQSQAPIAEQDRVRRLLPLPCDQRYGEADMMRLVGLLRQMGAAG